MTAHVPNCVICVQLYVLSFMLLFMEHFSHSSSIPLNNLLNIYSGIKLPSLPVSILYGTSIVVLPTCVSRCTVISKSFLLRYNEFILTVSIFSSCGSDAISTSTSWTAHSPYLCILSWSGLSSHIQHLSICWTLSWCMASPTISAWSFVICLACCFYVPPAFCFLNHFNFVKFLWLSYII